MEMSVDEIAGRIESSFGGNMNGVSVLVCGASDEGRLAIKLARHSAKVVQLTESARHYESVSKAMPQALDMLAIHTDISRWISSNIDHRFDVVVSFDSYLSIVIMLSDCGEVVRLRYSDGKYSINE